MQKKMNLKQNNSLIEELEKIAEELEKRMIKLDTKGKTITLKIKYSDFKQQTRSSTKKDFMQNLKEFFPVVKELLFQDKLLNSVRLLGLSFSNLNTVKKEPFWVQLKFDFNDQSF